MTWPKKGKAALKNIALNKCLAEILALRRHVNDTGRIFFLTASMTVIASLAKKLANFGLNLTKVKLEGVVKEGNKKPKNFLLKNREYPINVAEIRKVKFKKVVVLFSPPC